MVTSRPLRSRLLRLALAWCVAFLTIATLTLAGSASTAHAAAPLTVCPGVDTVEVARADGTTACVENTCEAVMGVDGNAAMCESSVAPLDVSVPAAGETGSGVAVPASARSAAAAGAARPAAAASREDSLSVAEVLLRGFAGAGLLALLVAAGLFAAGRRRAQRERTTG